MGASTFRKGRHVMIQQVAFEIPPAIAAGIARGEYRQFGGVVRDAAGRIVKHLKVVDIDRDADQAKQLAQQAIALAKKNPKAAIGAAAVAGVAVVGGAAYGVVKHIKGKKEREEHEARMAAFNIALNEYLACLGGEDLTVEKVDELEAAIDALADTERGFTVEIEGDQFKALVKSVSDYTARLAKANGMKVANPILQLFEKKPRDLNALRECLATQREIFELAA